MIFPSTIDLDEVLENSYRDFHVKGFDYLCLKRSPDETIKVYFFDGDVSRSPEVVIPHDHRYAFQSDILSGRCVNRKYVRAPIGSFASKVYERFDYLTPLNGGSGFTWREACALREFDNFEYRAGDGYRMGAEGIHTIQITAPETVLCLHQFADVLDVGTPTSAWAPDGMREAPNLSGLYRPMDADYALTRLAQAWKLMRPERLVA